MSTRHGTSRSACVEQQPEPRRRTAWPQSRGIDWASEWHDVCVADERRRRAAGRATLRARRGRDRRADRAAGRPARGARRDRAPRRAAGRAAARRRASRVLAIHPNQVAAARDRFRAAARQVRPLRRVRALRARAAPIITASPRSHPTATRRSRCGRSSAPARTWSRSGSRSPTSCAPSSTRFWPGAEQIFADVDSPDRARVPRALPQPRPTPAAWARSASPASSPATRYSGRRSAAELLDRLRSAPIAALGEARAEARRSRRRSASSPRWRRSSSRSACSPARSPAPSAPTPTARSSSRFFRDPKSVVTAAGLLAEIGDNRDRYPTAAALAADAGQAPVADRVRQDADTPASAGPATNACASRRRPRRQHPPLAPLGPRHLPAAPAPAAATTPTPSASSAAPGPASSGAAGKTNALRPHRHGNLNRLLAAQG